MKNIMKDLIAIANRLDKAGHYKLADVLDGVAAKLHKQAGPSLKAAMDAITSPDLQHDKYSAGYPSFDGAINSDLDQISVAWEQFENTVRKFPEEANGFLEIISKRTKSLLDNINKLIGLQQGDKKEEQFLAHNKKIQKAASDLIAALA